MYKKKTFYFSSLLGNRTKAPFVLFPKNSPIKLPEQYANVHMVNKKACKAYNVGVVANTNFCDGWMDRQRYNNMLPSNSYKGITSSFYILVETVL